MLNLALFSCDHKKENTISNEKSIDTVAIEKNIRIRPKLFLDFWGDMSFEEFEYVRAKLIVNTVLDTFEYKDPNIFSSTGNHTLTRFKIYWGAGASEQFILLPQFRDQKLTAIELLSPYDPFKVQKHKLLDSGIDQVIKLFDQKYGKPVVIESQSECGANFLDNKDKFFIYSVNNSNIKIIISLEHGSQYSGDHYNFCISGFKIKYMSKEEYKYREDIHNKVEEDKKNKIENENRETKERI